MKKEFFSGAVLCFVVLLCGAASAATRTVDTTSDNGSLTACAARLRPPGRVRHD